MSLFENIFNNKTEKKIEFFDLLALLNNFTKVKERVYEDKNGIRYVQTKLGFQKSEQFNLIMLNEELEKKILNLETDFRINSIKLKEKNIKYAELQKEYKIAFKNKKYEDRISAKQQRLNLLKAKKNNIKTELSKSKIELKTLREDIKENENYFNLNINDTILYAETNQIEKLLRKVKRISEYQNFLITKSKSQNIEINKLTENNEILKEEINKLKEKYEVE
ncbi:hypothetical protein [Flavobacterium sp.]|uniref:hypothetical protein n=1 Tax=Flavobacterium sp. TaxID=239 RepID=UPI003750DFE3